MLLQLILSRAGLGTLIRIPYIRVLAITDDFLFATVLVPLSAQWDRIHH
jgi:hypothetical protein